MVRPRSLNNDKFRFSLLFLLGLSVLASEGCSKVKVSDKPSASITDQGFVCSTLGSGPAPTANSGLKTELRYLSTDSTLSTEEKNKILSTKYFDDQDANFVKVPQTIYLSDVNTPTRKFQSGFQTSDGSLLKDNQGHVLIEYFALKMESVLKLGSQDPEGSYELASVSDDGSVVQIQENGQWSTLISNDGAHSTRMGCMSGKIQLTRQSRIPIRIYYNQGPRDEIANVLIWNYRGPSSTTASTVASDSSIHSYCDQSSSTDFWDPSSSSPGPWIQEVFSEGWKILTPDNFLLPNDEKNPCYQN